jgi:hypothetical protein
VDQLDSLDFHGALFCLVHRRYYGGLCGWTSNGSMDKSADRGMVGNLGVLNIGGDIGSFLVADCSFNSILRKYCVDVLVWMGFRVCDSSLGWWFLSNRKTLFRSIDPASTRYLFNLSCVHHAKDHFAVAFECTTELIYIGGGRRHLMRACNPFYLPFQ